MTRQLQSGVERFRPCPPTVPEPAPHEAKCGVRSEQGMGQLFTTFQAQAVFPLQVGKCSWSPRPNGDMAEAGNFQLHVGRIFLSFSFALLF